MHIEYEDMKATDYLTITLASDHGAREQIASQILEQLESVGLCRAVYHRLFNVLLDKALGDKRD